MESKGSSRASLAKAIVALFLYLLGTVILNNTLYAGAVDVFPEARDIATVGGAALLALLAYLARRRPRILGHPHWSFSVAFVFSLSALGIAFGVATFLPALLTLGAIARCVAGAWLYLMVIVAFSELTLSQATAGVLAAFILRGLVAPLLAIIPAFAAVGFYLVMPLLIVLLVERPCARRMERIMESPSENDLALVNARSFFGPTHSVFVSIVVFEAMIGFTLMMDSQIGVVGQATLALPAFAVLLLATLCGKRITRDALFLASTLMVLAGFLLLPIAWLPDSSLEVIASRILLASGGEVFMALNVLVLGALGKRNPVITVSVVLFASAAILAGTELGVAAGYTSSAFIGAGQPEMAMVLVAAITFLFMVYALVYLRSFSFEEIIAGVQPVKEPEVKTSPDDDFDARCNEIADSFGLTRKEREVAAMLARGYSRRAIEEKLVLSQNTIKAHVRSIYRKLDVHSQQEVIDLVEGP